MNPIANSLPAGVCGNVQNASLKGAVCENAGVEVPRAMTPPVAAAHRGVGNPSVVVTPVPAVHATTTIEKRGLLKEETTGVPTTQGSTTVSPNFFVYFSFERATGTKICKVSYGDLLQTHGVLTCVALKKEATSIFNHQAENELELGMEYKDPNGVLVGIQRELDVRYALADSVENGFLTIFVNNTWKAPPTKKPAPAVKAAATPHKLPKKCASSPKRAIAKPRKKSLKATKTNTNVDNAGLSSTQSVPLLPLGVASGAGSTQLLTGVELKIFLALAEFHALGTQKPQKQHIALLSNYKNVGSKSFVNGLKSVKQFGLVTDAPNNALQLTNKGIQCIPSDIRIPETNEAMKQRFLRVVNHKTAVKMYELLFDGQARDRVTLASAVGYTNLGSKAFREGIAVLKDLGFLECPDSNTARLADIAFPYGRP